MYQYGKVGKPANQKDNHQDTVQAIETDQTDTAGYFATAGWDGVIKIWQIQKGFTSTSPAKLVLKQSYELEEPVLSLAIIKNQFIFGGLGNGEIRAWSFGDNKNFAKVGEHVAGVIFLRWIYEINSLVSCGLDNLMNFYQFNQQRNGFIQVASFTLPQRTCCADISYPFMIICSLQKLRVYRIDNPGACNFSSYYDFPFDKSTKICSVNINAQARLLVIGTMDGWIGYFNFSEQGDIIADSNQSSRKVCVSRKEFSYSKQYLYPVNVVKIVNINNNLVILACDDVRYLSYLPGVGQIKSIKLKAPITAMNGSCFMDKNYLVIASGNDWCTGMQSIQKNYKSELEIRELGEEYYKKS